MHIKFFWRMQRTVFLLFTIITLALPAHSQIVTSSNAEIIRRDSIIRDYDSRPYFGLYKDNYFVFGPAVNSRPTTENSNVKFQISVSQKLTRSNLPFGTYLYLFYTQKAFWNILEDSMPFTDLNFNPGLGLTKPLFNRDRFIGKISLIIEHESNGRDSIYSRSWNRASLAASIFIDRNLMVYGKTWIPVIDGQHNKDILDYCGIYTVGTQFISNNRRFFGSMTVTRRAGSFFRNNINVEFGYRFSKRDNQFFFVQFYNGYGEGLLEYNKFHSVLRAGICIRPEFFSDY